ncbi:MAG: YkgJ family cysteine cluster protein [Elusimicrobia bacterium]|nr:YkgJ family cysteine cluster protein [Elusimicrobiota bacterium]
MDEIAKFKEEILKDYPRLAKESEFSFACHPGVPCFNGCCRDINIFLTPYDIIRLKKALAITSGEFLKKYTIMPFDKNLKYPVVMLKMEENENKTCPFVAKEGCKVYADRPWACRMYPLGLASPRQEKNAAEEEFYFLLQEAACKGLNEPKKWTVAGWMENQGVAEYDEMGRDFKYITLHKFIGIEQIFTPQKIEMFFMTCYDTDKFREFVFGSSFFNRFDVDEETAAKIKSDDKELLKFGFQWLRFALFNEKTMKIKAEIAEAKKEELSDRQKRHNGD